MSGGRSFGGGWTPWRMGLCVLASVWLGFIVSGAGRMSAAPQIAAPPQATVPATAAHATTFTRYCVSYHNEVLAARGTVPVALDGLDVADLVPDAELWERVVLKMRAGVMPPAGAGGGGGGGGGR
jgi:hypothetical protein